MRDALLLAAAVAAILGLAWLAEALAPPLVPLAALAEHEAQAVAVEALVTRARAAGPAAQALALADPTGSAGALWAATLPVEGAWVRAEGAVERDRGRWQLRVRALEVLLPPGAPLDAGQAARLAPALGGREVAVAGTLRWPTDGAVAIEGEGGALPLRAPAALAAHLVGERVLAEGAVRYEAARAGYALEAWGLRRA